MYVASFKLDGVQHFVRVFKVESDTDLVVLATTSPMEATKTYTRAGVMELIEIAKPKLPEATDWPESKDQVLMASQKNNAITQISVSPNGRGFFKTTISEWVVEPQSSEEEDTSEYDADADEDGAI